MTASEAADGTSTPSSPTPWGSVLAAALKEIYTSREAAARCRRGLGKEPMQVAEMWQYCVPVADAALKDLRCGRGRAEAAAHHVLTLYAVHQQSQDTPMNQARRSVGTAARLLYGQRESEGVRQRFLAAATATSVPELAGHLRHLVPQLREEKIPLSYAGLFRDIVDWADPERRAQVRRLWGLDFHQARRPAPGRIPDNNGKETS